MVTTTSRCHVKLLPPAEQSSLHGANVFSDIFDNKWSSLESVKEIEQYASERCADGQENPRLEGRGEAEILLSFQTRS